jgi:glucosyl-dolichyl phosphate glucuronosyltransferase
MTITVVVCTYNRCQVLRKALESIAQSRVPERVEWEVLVVDNNSSDTTAEMVAELRSRFPGRFRYLFESEQGKSFALNAAIRESPSDVLAFTDDDIIVDPWWLWNLTADLETDAWGGSAGRVIPVWDRPIPRWLDLDELLLAGPYVAFDLGDEPGALTKAPFGANMAFRSEVFGKHGGFRTDLGRIGTHLRCGEDTEFVRRLLSAGERLRYQPAAVVYHPVAEERLRKGYLLSWFFWYACSDRMQSGRLPEARWSLAGVPIYLVRRLARWSLQWTISTEAAARFSCSMNLSRVAGEGFGCYRLWRSMREERAATREEVPSAGKSTAS